MRKVLKYNGKVITLKPYSTIVERDLLLYTSGDYDFNTLFNILTDNIEINDPFSLDDLSFEEKKLIILELRQISVGEVFSFIRKCSNCGEKYETDVSFENTIEEGNLEDFNNIQLEEAFSTDYNDYVDFDIDELNIDVYDALVEHINKNRTKFNFSAKSVCVHCKNINIINLSTEHLVANLSEDTLANFYQTIASMVYYGHYTKQDIDNMLPFERTILLNILNEEIKKANTRNI
jgi:hypothetical protein